MEAPSICFDFKKDKVENKLIKKIKEFQILSNNKIKYNIFFEIITSNLLITAYPENSKIKYEQYFSLEDIQKVKLFVAYDNLEECLDEIIEGLNMNQNSIVEETNSIKLIISLKNKKYNEIIFELKKLDKNIEEKFKDFSEQIIRENEINKKEINLLKKENNELKQEIINLKKEIKKINDKHSIIGNKKIFYCIKYEKHPCYLILVDINNKDKYYLNYNYYMCDECHKKYDIRIPNFNCSKCKYDLCLECFGKSQV